MDVPFLVCNFRIKACMFSPLKLMLVVRFLWIFFTRLKKFPSIPGLLEVFSMNGYWIFKMLFLCQLICCCCSVTQSCLTLCDIMNPKHARFPCPSPSPGDCSNSRPLSQWCLPTISFSVILFSSCLQPLPALKSFLMSQLFASGGQSIGASASASVLPMNIQGWFRLGLIDLISL